MHNLLHSKSASKAQAFNKTIVEQIELIINDQELMAKATEKTQGKRDSYRVLGSSNIAESLETKDPNLFNDHDYYQLLLNDFLSSNDKSLKDEGVDNTANGAGGDDFLYGADLSLTQKNILKKQKLKELQQQRKKEIDRKATKGRKIKYVVHDKLLNFMVPIDNDRALDGKDQILSNLFSLKKEAAQRTAYSKEDAVKLI